MNIQKTSTPSSDGLCASRSFAHRLNADGKVDSICRNCFVTVATEANERALEERESDHVCEPYLVERFRSFTREERED